MAYVLSEKEQEFSIKGLDKGYSARRIGRDLGGVDHKIIVRFALKSGFVFVGRQRLMRPERKEEFRTFLEHSSGGAAARHFKMPHSTMLSIAKHLGINLLERYQVAPETKKRIVEVRKKKKLSTRQIAKEVDNTNAETVRRVLRAAGIKLPSQSEAASAFLKQLHANGGPATRTAASSRIKVKSPKANPKSQAIGKGHTKSKKHAMRLTPVPQFKAAPILRREPQFQAPAPQVKPSVDIKRFSPVPRPPAVGIVRVAQMSAAELALEMRQKAELWERQKNLFIDWATSPLIKDETKTDPEFEARRRAQVHGTLHRLRNRFGSFLAENG